METLHEVVETPMKRLLTEVVEAPKKDKKLITESEKEKEA